MNKYHLVYFTSFFIIYFYQNFQINNMENCPFKDIVKTCTGSLSEKNDEIGKLKTFKGMTGINKASKKRGIDLVVEVGMRVHNSCRQK